VEAGEGSATLRLTGTGAVRLDEPRVALKLEGRRLDLDGFILSASGRELAAHAGTWSLPPAVVPIDLDLSLNSIALAQEELSNVSTRLTLERGRAMVERLELEAPGQTRLSAAGEVGLTMQGGGNGRVQLASTASDRFARYLAKLGLSVPGGTLLDGRPLEAAADVVHAAPVTSFRNVRLKIGDAALTGNIRYTDPEPPVRGRLEAQVALQGLDLTQLPQIGSLFEATQNLDLGFILDARDVRHGASKGAGRIAARIMSDAPALVVETLEITDLAGANARVSGRIAPDGTGRIEGRVKAERAAPLVDLIGTVWVGDVSRLVPTFLRQGALDLGIVAERAPPGERTGGLRLKTTARGTAAGGLFEADVLSADGFTESLNVRLATGNTGTWVGRPEVAILRRPSHLDLRGVRVASGNFNITVAGDIGGVRIDTTRPIALGSGDDVVDAGEADVSAADVTPFLALLGDGAGVEPPVPVRAHVKLGRERDAPLLVVSGRIGDAAVDARLSARARSDIGGTVTVDRLSLPWLAAAFALNARPDPRATSLWSTVRFGETHRVVDGGQVAFKVGRLELGRGLMAQDAAFKLALTGDDMAVRDLAAGLAGGQVTGTVSISRQGTMASLSGEGSLRDASLAALGAPPLLGGKLWATLRFGAAGETMSSLIANLSGAGDLRLADPQVMNADPGAIERGLSRALRGDDPLNTGRLEAMLREELNRAPFRGSTVASPATLVGGVLRLSPVHADAPAASWQGLASLDFKTLSFEARGTLNAKSAPKGWTGSPPYIVLGWRGPLANPTRELDVGTLTNGVASIVLQREIERIEAFEADANERARLNQQREMERARERAKREAEEAARREAEEAARRAAEEAARQRAAEEAARRAEEAARRAEEARQARIRQQQLEAERARHLAPPPIDIRPPSQVQGQPPG
jgi:AsmA-like C-terminal region